MSVFLCLHDIPHRLLVKRQADYHVYWTVIFATFYCQRFKYPAVNHGMHHLAHPPLAVLHLKPIRVSVRICCTADNTVQAGTGSLDLHAHLLKVVDRRVVHIAAPFIVVFPVRTRRSCQVMITTSHVLSLHETDCVLP